MRILSFPRPIRLAAALPAAAIALLAWLALSPPASAQASSDAQGSSRAATQQPDACIQIYPPPPGCPVRRTPPSSPPSVYPGGAAAPRVPTGAVVTDRPRYRPGDAISVIFRDGSGPFLGGSAPRCVDVDVEVLGSAGWSRVPGVELSCSGLAFAAGYGWRAEILPADLQPGTYRLAFRLTTPAGGQQAIYSDPFVVG